MFACALEYYLRTSWKGGQKTLSAETGISISTISQIKTGNTQSSVKNYQTIASAFGFNLDEFLKKGREIKLHGKPLDVKPEVKNNIYELPVKYTPPPPPINDRLIKLREHLDVIFNYDDETLITAIEMNLTSFRKIIDNEKRVKVIEDKLDKFETDNLSLKEENENLKNQIIRMSG